MRLCLGLILNIERQKTKQGLIRGRCGLAFGDAEFLLASSPEMLQMVK